LIAAIAPNLNCADAADGAGPAPASGARAMSGAGGAALSRPVAGSPPVLVISRDAQERDRDGRELVPPTSLSPDTINYFFVSAWTP